MKHETFSSFMVWLHTQPDESHGLLMRAKLQEMYDERNGASPRFVFTDKELPDPRPIYGQPGEER